MLMAYNHIILQKDVQNRDRTMQITFLGATGTVTGSKYLVAFDDKKILVDCG